MRFLEIIIKDLEKEELIVMRAASQFKKGALEMCVLYLINQKDYYGYEITQEVNKTLSVTEGAVYPVLRRLTNEKYCKTYEKASPDGPKRKYYSITEDGRLYLKLLENDWDTFVNDVNKLRGRIE